MINKKNNSNWKLIYFPDLIEDGIFGNSRIARTSSASIRIKFNNFIVKSKLSNYVADLIDELHWVLQYLVYTLQCLAVLDKLTLYITIHNITIIKSYI